jgi:hypothetical protein
MKRMVAWGIYMLGALLALRALITGFVEDSLYWGFAGVTFAVAIWWIAVGFGVRLGVTPDEFVASILSSLGFGRHYEEQPTSSQSTDNL